MLAACDCGISVGRWSERWRRRWRSEAAAPTTAAVEPRRPEARTVAAAAAVAPAAAVAALPPAGLGARPAAAVAARPSPARAIPTLATLAKARSTPSARAKRRATLVTT